MISRQIDFDIGVRIQGSFDVFGSWDVDDWNVGFVVVVGVEIEVDVVVDIVVDDAGLRLGLAVLPVANLDLEVVFVVDDVEFLEEVAGSMLSIVEVSSVFASFFGERKAGISLLLSDSILRNQGMIVLNYRGIILW